MCIEGIPFGTVFRFPKGALVITHCFRKVLTSMTWELADLMLCLVRSVSAAVLWIFVTMSLSQRLSRSRQKSLASSLQRLPAQERQEMSRDGAGISPSADLGYGPLFVKGKFFALKMELINLRFHFLDIFFADFMC